jgi:hypothetical protein
MVPVDFPRRQGMCLQRPELTGKVAAYRRDSGELAAAEAALRQAAAALQAAPNLFLRHPPEQVVNGFPAQMILLQVVQRKGFVFLDPDLFVPSGANR